MVGSRGGRGGAAGGRGGDTPIRSLGALRDMGDTGVGHGRGHGQNTPFLSHVLGGSPISCKINFKKWVE